MSLRAKNSAQWKMAPQLEGRIVRAFYSNSFVNTMETVAAIQYILTAAQPVVSQDYYKKSRMTILGLLVYYSAKTSRHGQNGLSYVPKKILGCLGNLGEVSKQQ